ncbi:hypothetical protein [Pseudarthrobacter phenanthrenivorans]|uniref:Uncharacterized protein n=1 Tax=Pseudarthrobacter phenanthrenivorans TaxID=361575 RepID=A0A0B4DIM5_PSEPS|nr:hypothetical protein [Pseudarthrobacter phenanthrenivorans]KIC68687.1 hypothetical protein RM50_04265 [Pseudarthrobacter phenanthrenivorans]
MPAILTMTPASIEELRMLAASLPVSTVGPRDFARRIAVRAYSLGLSDSELIGFLKRQTAKRPGLSSVLTDRLAFRQLLASCRRAALSSSPAGRRKNAGKTARLTLGRILAPVVAGADGVALSPARQIRARTALAIVCVEQLKSINGEKGWNTIRVSYPWLALRLGSSWPTAKAALNDLLELGWIHEPSAGLRPGQPRRFKISGYLNPDQRALVQRLKDNGEGVVEPGLYEAIGALAEQENEASQRDLLGAAVTRSVNHPAWTYGEAPLGAKTWLLTLARAAGVDPVQLGLPKRSIPALNRLMAEAGLDRLIGSAQGDTSAAESDLPGQLAEVLKTWAKATGAYEAAAAASAAYKDNAKARTDEIARVRKLRVDAGPAMDRLFGEVASIPAAGSSADRLNTWVAGASNAIAKVPPMTKDRRNALTRELKKRLKKRSYQGDAITLVAEKVMANARPLLGAAETVPLATDDPAVKTAWLRGVTGAMQGKAMQVGERNAFEAELKARFRSRGYERDKAGQMAALILKDVALAA